MYVIVKMLEIYNKDDEHVKSIELTQSILFNERFKRKNSILDIMLQNNIQIIFGCMGGSCSACVCEIKSGEEFIDREGNGAQIYNMIEENELLTCIATINDNYDEDKKIEIKLKY